MRGTVSKKLIPLLTQVSSGLAQAKASGAAFEPSVIRQNLENVSAYMLPGPDVESGFAMWAAAAAARHLRAKSPTGHAHDLANTKVRWYW